MNLWLIIFLNTSPFLGISITLSQHVLLLEMPTMEDWVKRISTHITNCIQQLNEIGKNSKNSAQTTKKSNKNTIKTWISSKIAQQEHDLNINSSKRPNQKNFPDKWEEAREEMTKAKRSSVVGGLKEEAAMKSEASREASHGWRIGRMREEFSMYRKRGNKKNGGRFFWVRASHRIIFI